MSLFFKWFKKVLSWPFIFLIRVYQIFISPLTPPSCRFYPSCSSYGLEAFRRHNPIKAFGLTVWRVLRCNPWNPGGYDPVPGTEEDGEEVHQHE